jgi:hypothetical protein
MIGVSQAIYKSKFCIILDSFVEKCSTVLVVVKSELLKAVSLKVGFIMRLWAFLSTLKVMNCCGRCGL